MVGGRCACRGDRGDGGGEAEVGEDAGDDVGCGDELGDGIEWDHSYLTDEGTYCVYRAVDEVKIHQHAAITGAPVNKVSEVRRLVASQWTF